MYVPPSEIIYQLKKNLHGYRYTQYYLGGAGEAETNAEMWMHVKLWNK